MVEEVQIYLYTLKISICLGVLEIEGNTDNANENRIEGEILTTSAFHIRDARSLSFTF